MGYHLRYQSTQWATHHIVSRCFRGYSLLKPTPDVVEVCAGVLAYSLHRYQGKIQLHHYAFLSNHFHLLLSARDVLSLAEFMRDFKSSLTRELGRIYDWRGTMWESRYANEEVLDEEGLIEIFKYITKNSVKEGLVDHPRQWKGLHGYHQLVDGEALSGHWFDRTGYYRAQQRRNLSKQSGETISRNDFITEYTVNLTPPPLWNSLTDDAYESLCDELMSSAIAEATREREGESLGMTKVLASDTFKVRFTKRSTRPLCRAKCPEVMKSYLERYYEFKRCFQSASAELREMLKSGTLQVSIIFPFGGIPLIGRARNDDKDQVICTAVA